jgi:hypothetical protein
MTQLKTTVSFLQSPSLWLLPISTRLCVLVCFHRRRRASRYKFRDRRQFLTRPPHAVRSVLYERPGAASAEIFSTLCQLSFNCDRARHAWTSNKWEEKSCVHAMHCMRSRLIRPGPFVNGIGMRSWKLAWCAPSWTPGLWYFAVLYGWRTSRVLWFHQKQSCKHVFCAPTAYGGSSTAP